MPLTFRAAPGRLPPGRRVYAVGDVHGCESRLAALHEAIAGDLAARPADAVLVHLGDYVDRGPDSAGVIARLLAGPPPGIPAVNLMGNHERTLLDALAGAPAAATDWMWNGGAEALRSWGGDPEAPRTAWPACVPPAHRAFLAGLPLAHREGGYIFVHAGLRPGLSLEAQAQADLLGIRQPFLTSNADFGAIIVHGHTPQPEPVLRHNRLGIDTGAVYGGALTCAVLEENRVAFLAA